MSEPTFIESIIDFLIRNQVSILFLLGAILVICPIINRLRKNKSQEPK